MDDAQKTPQDDITNVPAAGASSDVVDSAQTDKQNSDETPKEQNLATDIASSDPASEQIEEPNTQTATQPSPEEAVDEENTSEEPVLDVASTEAQEESESAEGEAEISEDEDYANMGPRPRWYVVHTYSGHENRVAATLKQRIDSEHLEDKILDVLVPTQDKIEIRSGKKETVKEKIFPGYILVKMLLDDASWTAIRTTQGVTSFVGMSNKPTPIPDHEVSSIVKFMQQGAQPTFKQVYSDGDTVKIIDGPFAEFIGKVDSVDKEKGKVRVLVSIFGRETPVELDFLQVQKL